MRHATLCAARTIRISTMELTGVALGVVVALLWGTADSVAAVAARGLGALQATFLSQAAGLLALTTLDVLSPALRPTLTPGTLVTAVLLGSGTGLCATVGYYAFYKGMMIGPVVLVSPISSTSAAVTLVLSMLLLHDRVATLQVAAIGGILIGIVLASTDVRAARQFRNRASWRTSGQSGIRYALLATLAFGAMDFGIGASARAAGFFFPVLISRTFSLLFLTTCICWMQYQERPRQAYTSARQWRKHTCQSKQQEDSSTSASPPNATVVMLAASAGLVENAAVLLFSIDTRIATTGLAAAIASTYAVVTMLVGLLAFRERLVRSQVAGIGLVLGSLALLALNSP